MTLQLKIYFYTKKEIKEIKVIVLRNMKNLFEYEKEEENLYKPVRVSNFWSKNYIEYKSNNYKNNILPVEEYLLKIRPYLKSIINNPKKSYTWKIQLPITISFFSSEDDNDKKHVMHSKTDA